MKKNRFQNNTKNIDVSIWKNIILAQKVFNFYILEYIIQHELLVTFNLQLKTNSSIQFITEYTFYSRPNAMLSYPHIVMLMPRDMICLGLMVGFGLKHTFVSKQCDLF